MSGTERRAWQRQAEADYSCIDRVLDLDDPTTYCQVIAKCQQAMEKTIKALVATLRDADILSIEIGYGHGVTRFTAVLIRMPRASENRDIHNHVRRLLDQESRRVMADLDRLAPRRPSPGLLPARNTEYPYWSGIEGGWTAPADPGTFRREDVDRFRLLACRLVLGCSRLISAIERALPMREDGR